MRSSRLRRFCVASCTILGCFWLSVPASGQDLLPNLRALPPTDLSVVTNADTGNPELRLTATSWNSGAGALELNAGPAGQAGQDVYQRIYQKNGTYRTNLAGTFVWHPEHNHFHFQEYAVYTLRPISAPGASQRQAYKTSFCVTDTTKLDGRLPGAPRKPVYAICNQFVQGMSVGWADSYGWQLAGQAIDLTGNPDGLYELTVDIDPRNHLVESDDTDNTACVLLQIGVAARTVQTIGGCGIVPGGRVTVESVTPSSIWAGTIVDLVIRGTNFAEGMAVGFENGSGPAPVASNVTVLDSTTIALTVTVKPGGNASDRVWDVRVGSAVLTNAFEVLK